MPRPTRRVSWTVSWSALNAQVQPRATTLTGATTSGDSSASRNQGNGARLQSKKLTGVSPLLASFCGVLRGVVGAALLFGAARGECEQSAAIQGSNSDSTRNRREVSAPAATATCPRGGELVTARGAHIS
eukprot:Amastigsp_a175438_24.p2 type:complete len:130 gc:universal Amastigsp_a175438_24:397-8(-)